MELMLLLGSERTCHFGQSTITKSSLYSPHHIQPSGFICLLAGRVSCTLDGTSGIKTIRYIISHYQINSMIVIFSLSTIKPMPQRLFQADFCSSDVHNAIVDDTFRSLYSLKNKAFDFVYIVTNNDNSNNNEFFHLSTIFVISILGSLLVQMG